MIAESRLLILSAVDEKALEGRFSSLVQALSSGKVASASEAELADVAFTLAAGRRAFPQRAAIVLGRNVEPAGALAALRFEQLERGVAAQGPVDVAMMFPGQGSQFVGMGRELYELSPLFRQILDRCDALAAPRLGLSLRDLLFRSEPGGPESETLKQTAIAQPALFVIEYALAEVLRSYGVVPSVLIGHSIGEYAAACVAGVFELDQALELVIERGRLMQSMPPGTMLAVRCRPEQLAEHLDAELTLAAHNAPELCVVAGPSAAVERFASKSAELGLETQALHTSHAFHSAMMDPILDPFAQAVARSSPRAPRLPIVSGLTGKILGDDEARSPEYWANQLRHTVRFADGVATLCEREDRVLCEVGPGTALMTSAAKQTAGVRPRRLLETLGHPKLDRPAFEATLRCLGRLWIEGVSVDWHSVYDAAKRRFVRLPTYPFTRKRHWVSVPKPSAEASPLASANGNGHALGAPSLAASSLAASSLAASSLAASSLAASSLATSSFAAAALGADAAVVPAAVEEEPSPLDLARARLGSVLENRLGRALASHEISRSFVELGFDSLALTQLSGKVREEFAVRIPFRRFFEDLGTPAQLAEYLAVEAKPAPRPAKAKPNGKHANGGVAVAAVSVAREPLRLDVPAALGADAWRALDERLARIERALEALAHGQRSLNGAASAEAVAAPPPREPDLARFEPTAAQREIWIACSVGGEAATLAYNECRAFALNGPLDVNALAAALDALAERHESLRQTFSADGSVCITSDRAKLPLAELDLSARDASTRAAELEAARTRQVTTPFDLERGPLVRAELVKLGDEEHVLLLCAHHIVVDGYSFGLLTRELAELYSARVEQRPPSLPEAESFARYAAEENAYAASPAAGDDQAYWLDHLAGHSEDLTLPTDAPRPAQRSYRSARLDWTLDAGTVARLRERAAAASASMQTLLMAAFQVFLRAISRQSDIVLGVPASGQAAVGADTLVGHCVHVLPVRVSLTAEASFATHVRSLSATLLDALEHQRTTFSDLLHRLERPRDPSRIPLIPVAFGMGRSLKHPSFSGLSASLGVVPRVSESFELYVYVTEDRDALEVSWSFNRDLFSTETIACWQRCFSAVLADICSRGLEQRVDDVEVLDESDRRRLLELAWGPRSRVEHRPVHERIAEQARLSPTRVALVDSAGSHTYAELDQRANRIAHWLRARVSEPNGLVAVCLERGLDLVAALLGVWRAGLGYVPLDPAYPRARIEMILEDAGASLVLTSRSLAERTPEGATRAFLDAIEDELSALPDVAPQRPRDAGDIAYVIFTSGSTGRPKGVAIPQGAFENFIVSMQREPGFGPGDRLLAITTISFDIAGLELFLPLACGGSIVLATRDQAIDPRELMRLLVEHDITVMQATPATWQMLFDGGWTGKRPLKVLCGGEAFPRHLAERFLAAGAETWNVYGPTETTVWSTAKLVTDPAALTIGRPIDNTSVYVLDEQRRLVPLGTTGELWIGGHGVAQGYLGRPDLTAERFVDSPFEAGDRIYRTGDLARLRHDGELECLGRADFQVKIRGFRIELGEIETAISKHPAVATNVVVAREDRPGDKQLVGYLVLKPGAALDAEALRATLSTELPHYMVPAALVVLDALPMTPNNKVDRKALPAPQVSDGYRPPEDVRRVPSDELLWEEVWVEAKLQGEPVAPMSWLVLVDELGVGQELAQELERRGHVVTSVHSRDRYHERAESEYTVNPELGKDDIDRLLKRLEELGRTPDRIVHLWSLAEGVQHRPGSSSYHYSQEHGLYSLLHLGAAHARHAASKAVVHHVVGHRLFADALTPEQRERTTILGACRVLPNALPRQQVRALDLELDGARSAGGRRKIVQRLLHELLEGATDPEVRYRGAVRQVPIWQPQKLEQLRLPVPAGSALVVGVTAVGLACARALARAPGVKVVLVHDAMALADEQREALARLEQSGVVSARFVASTTNPSELVPIVERIRTEQGPLKSLVLATADALPMPLRDMTEADVEARAASKLHSLQAFERVLSLESLELVVVHNALDARLGAPTYLAEAVAGAFVEKRLGSSRARWVVCNWGPRLASEGGSNASSQVERDREHFQRSGLTDQELDIVAASVLGAPTATLAISPFELTPYRERLMLSSAKDSGQGSGRVFVEPSTDTERRLARLWMEALRLDRVSIRDSFFDLGGHSLLAARLFSKLHAEFGVTLPLAVLVEAPTIEALAARIDLVRAPDAPRPAQAVDQGLLVRLNVGSDPRQAPIFVVGGALGNVLNLRYLARICDPRRDFYGIQARGLTGEAEPHRSLIDAAQTYVEEVRRVQPNGPYYLGGFCIGGVVALEMARLLREQSEEIGLLAMLDSHLPEVRGRLDLKDRAQIQYERLRDGGLDYVREWARSKYAHSRLVLEKKLRGSSDDPDDPTQYRSQLVSDAIMYARSVYQPRFYDGHIVLFRPPLAPHHYLSGGRVIDRDRAFLKEDNGWRGMVKSMEVQELACPAGEHDGFVLEPYVRDLARRIRELLPNE